MIESAFFDELWNPAKDRTIILENKEMKSNPCRQCELKNQDKNNQICMYCDKRLDYVSHLERELNFAMTNTEQRPASPRLPTFSQRSYVLSAVSGTY
jgi:hypothetical protein